MLNIKTDLFLTYSIILIIPLLVTGSFIPDLLMSICVIFYISYLIKIINLIHLKIIFIYIFYFLLFRF